MMAETVLLIWMTVKVWIQSEYHHCIVTIIILYLFDFE